MGRTCIHGELLKLGYDICGSAIAKCMVRRSGLSTRSWQTFIGNHIFDIVAIDFFTVPTATIRTLCVFLVMSLDRRCIVHLNVTAKPTADGTSLQLLQTFPFDSAPKYLIRDRDGVYGKAVDDTLRMLEIEQAVTAPRSPWQDGYSERIIGTIRRVGLDHVTVMNENHLRRVLKEYLADGTPIADPDISRPHPPEDRDMHDNLTPLRFDILGLYADEATLGATIAEPTGILALDPGFIVLDAGTNRILRYADHKLDSVDLAEIAKQIAPTETDEDDYDHYIFTEHAYPRAIAAGPDGDLYVSIVRQDGGGYDARSERILIFDKALAYRGCFGTFQYDFKWDSKGPVGTIRGVDHPNLL